MEIFDNLPPEGNGDPGHPAEAVGFTDSKKRANIAETANCQLTSEPSTRRKRRKSLQRNNLPLTVKKSICQRGSARARRRE